MTGFSVCIDARKEDRVFSIIIEHIESKKEPYLFISDENGCLHQLDTKDIFEMCEALLKKKYQINEVA